MTDEASADLKKYPGKGMSCVGRPVTDHLLRRSRIPSIRSQVFFRLLTLLVTYVPSLL